MSFLQEASQAHTLLLRSWQWELQKQMGWAAASLTHNRTKACGGQQTRAYEQDNDHERISLK
jgi:hypothetical protein